MGKHQSNLLPIVLFLWLAGSLHQLAIAQSITTAPDGTGTITTPLGNQINITGGQLSRDGANLFHSFERFGLSESQVANFLSHPNLQNILGRVIGGEASIINGRIQISGGNANLFLMNPAGIVFGSTASLNVPASFYATTANGIGFGNQWFHAVGSNDYANLVGIPSSFAFSTPQPGAIINAGDLAVSSGQTLSLLGGTVISTGTLTAPDGQIAIVAVPGENLLRIRQTGRLLNLEFAPIASTTAFPIAPSPIDLPQLLTGGNLNNASGLTINHAGQIELTSSHIPINAGDVIAQNILASTATLSAAHNLSLVESRLNTTGDLNLLAKDTVLIRDSVTTPFTAHSGGNLYIQGNQGIDILALNYLQQETPFQANGNLSLVSNGNISGDTHFASGRQFSILALSGKPGNLVSLYDPIISANGDVQFGNYIGASLKVEATGSIVGGNITITAPDITLVGLDPDIVTLSSGRSLILRAGLTTLSNPVNIPQLAVPTDGTNFIPINSGLPPGSIQVGTINARPTIPVFGGTGSVILSATGDLIAGSINPDLIGAPPGGPIEITVGGNLQVGDLNADQFNGPASPITLRAGGQITTGAIRSISVIDPINPGNSGGGAISLSAGEGITVTGNLASWGGLTSADITLLANKDISINCTDSSFCIQSFAGGTPGFLAPGNSGNVTINSNSGKVIFNSTNPSFFIINTAPGGTGNAGDIRITANTDIEIPGTILGGSNATIALISKTGSVNVQNLASPSGNQSEGGDISVQAASQININQITTDSNFNAAGGVTLVAPNVRVNDSISMISSVSRKPGKPLNINASESVALSGAVNTNGADITIFSDRNLEISNILNSSSDLTKGGNVTLASINGSITTAGINSSGVTGGGTITISAPNQISTGQLNSSSSTGNGADIIITSNSFIAADSISSVSTSSAGGAITLTGSNITLNGQVTLGSETGNSSGALILNTPGAVQLPSNVLTNGASIISSQPLLTLAGLSSGSTINTGGGNITIPLSTNFTLPSTMTLNTDGGDITITSPGALTIATPLDSSSTIRKGGNITLVGNRLTVDAPLISTSTIANGGGIYLTSTETLTVNAPLTTTSTVATSGEIELRSNNGAVFATDLTTSGSSGNTVLVQAATEIKTGQINTSATNGNGGDVILDPPGNVEVVWINTQAPNGRGGSVDITTGRFFVASGTFTALNGSNASISTIGGTGSGSVTIRHDGGARFVNFNISNLLDQPFTNGTAGVITTGAFTLNLGEFYPGPYTRGNIRLITTPRSTFVPEAIPTKALELNDRGTLFPLEELYTREFEDFDGRRGETPVLTLEKMQDTLQQVEDGTGIKPALIYVGFVSVPSSTPTDCEPGEQTPDPDNPGKTKPCECRPVKLPDDPEGWSKNVVEYEPSPCDRLALTLVTSKGKPVYVPLAQVPRHQILIGAEQFRKFVQEKTSLLEDYQQLGNQLYQWLVKPLQVALQEREIQNLSFLMPAQLRLLPLAALVDDNQKFLAETYSSGLMPSLSLVDTRKVEIKFTYILAMGTESFKPDQNQLPLPFAEKEVQAIIPSLWSGRLFLRQDFTFNNLAIPRQISPYGIAHLATHGQFNEQYRYGMIQLWNQKIDPSDIRRLDWSKPPLELLVLSACRTAYGDRVSELGFAGAASRIGVKSIIGSLWFVEDNSTMELMKSFYTQLRTAPIKADALAEAQKEMIKSSFQHPYHWSAFTMVGNPW
ncbi:CHAT domain-containing protein [Pantanalinema rosaneae CENA516]|uniref:CHAT domain-containing protein n=1 Tax=Pantanalinema rosaneae TaxID=1620701 RepID=UPI003D6FBF8C